MKKLVLSALLMLASASASAAFLSVVGSNPIAVFTGYDGEPVTYTGVRTSGVTGTLTASRGGNVIYTYLGQESGDINKFISFEFLGSQELTEGNVAGTDFIGDGFFSAGALKFKFTDTTTSQTFTNGDSRIAIMSGSPAFSYGPFDYILGFNDSFGDNDYDDFVVGLSFQPSTVPVPAALPLLATALGLFGFSRRKSI